MTVIQRFWKNGSAMEYTIIMELVLIIVKFNTIRMIIKDILNCSRTTLSIVWLARFPFHVTFSEHEDKSFGKYM